MNNAAVCMVNGVVTACPKFLGYFMGGFSLVFLVVMLFIIFSMWKVFTKAGKPGWGAIIPIYNVVLLLEIVRKPTWWIILCLIPFVNIIVMFIVMHNLSKV